MLDVAGSQFALLVEVDSDEFACKRRLAFLYKNDKKCSHRIETNCCCARSWHCQRLPAPDSSAQFGPPAWGPWERSLGPVGMRQQRRSSRSPGFCGVFDCWNLRKSVACLFGVLRLAGPGLAGDQHGLVLVVLQHVSVGLVRDGELEIEEGGRRSWRSSIHLSSNQMGWHLCSALAHVHSGTRVRVDGQPLVRVDHHAEEAGISLKWHSSSARPKPIESPT
jgi:hypothetical protein